MSSDLAASEGLKARGAMLGETIRSATRAAVDAAFFGSVKAALGAYPTRSALIDVTEQNIAHAHIPGLVHVDATVFGDEYNETRDRVQGKVLTSQPHGPSGGPDGVITVSLKPFTPGDGFVTLHLTTHVVAAFIVGDTVVYPAPGATHFGVRMRADQVSQLVIVAQGVAALGMHYAFVADRKLSAYQGTVVDMLHEHVYSGTGAYMHTERVSVSLRAFSYMNDPMFYTLSSNTKPALFVRFRKGRVLVGNALHKAYADWIVLAVPDGHVGVYGESGVELQVARFVDGGVVWSAPQQPLHTVSARL